MGYRREADAAARLAREAGDLALEYFRPDKMETRAKGERDVVTAADLAAEHLILAKLRQEFPDDGVIGEEGSDVGSPGTRLWCIDPVDGTMNYSRGIPVWCVSVSLFEAGRPVAGAIHDPIRGETFCASRGEGVRVNGREAGTSGSIDPSSALIHVTIDFEEDSQGQGLEDVHVLAPRVLRTRNIGSAALALAYVACGRLDAMLHRFAHAWDYGAGVILIQEAGGCVTGFNGEPYSIDSSAIVAAASVELNERLRAIVGPAQGARLE